MKSISTYIYDKRAIIGEFLFWLFWFFNNCMYVGSVTNMFTSGVLFWSFINTITSYITYRLVLACVRRLFLHYKYAIYLFFLYLISYFIKTIINEIVWQIALDYLDFGTFQHDYEKMINIDTGGMMKRLSTLMFEPFVFFSQPTRWIPISIKIMIDLAIDQRKNNALQKSKMDFEIKLLKSQINPKFIHESLEHLKKLATTDSDRAAQMVLKLANTTRYTLYETDFEQVPLQKELDFIINCIDLEEIRLGEAANVNFRLKTEQTEGLQIAPMLLFPLIEKTFRCLKQQCEIDLWVENRQLTLKIEADKIPHCQSDDIAPLKKRLEYYFPSKYRLQVVENEQVFRAELRLELNT